jgi:hypothetical protein
MSKTTTTRRRYYTPEQANRTLPLVRSIVRDIIGTTQEVKHCVQQLLDAESGPRRGDPNDKRNLNEQLEQHRDRLESLRGELAALGIVLKDYEAGLVDYWAKLDGRDVFLCWKHDEPEVDCWHELHTGFGGRQPIRDAGFSG